VGAVNVRGLTCVICNRLVMAARIEDGEQLCSKCLAHILPLRDGQFYDRQKMIECVRAKIAERALRGSPQSGTEGTDDVLPMPTAIVPAGVTTTLTIQAQFVCKPRVLRMTEDAARAFQIEAIIVGNRCQFDASNGVSAQFFAESYQQRFGNIPLAIDTLFPALNFSMKVTNHTDAPAVFEAMWEVEKLVK